MKHTVLVPTNISIKSHIGAKTRFSFFTKAALSEVFPTVRVYGHVLPHGAATPAREKGFRRKGLNLRSPICFPSPHSWFPRSPARLTRLADNTGGRQGKPCSVVPAVLEQFWSSRKDLQFINIRFVSKEFRSIQRLGGSRI